MRIVIFGASSAIAIACARQWVAQGASLFLVARNADRLGVLIQDLSVRKSDGQTIAGASADLAQLDTHAALFAEAQAAIGPIDTVLVAHGSLPDQTACQDSVPDVLAEINTNGLSAISLATLAAQRIEANGGGTVAVISSVAGDRGRGSNYVYGAAKGLVSLYLEGMRNRFAKSKVHVLTIKPGFVDTPMTAHIEKKGALWAKSEQVGAAIVRGVAKRSDTIYVPGFWRPIMFVIRHIPERIFKKMSL